MQRLVGFSIRKVGIGCGKSRGYYRLSRRFGKLKKAIEDGQTVSHVHIEVKVAGTAVDPLPYLATEIDPETGEVKQPCP